MEDQHNRQRLVAVALAMTALATMSAQAGGEAVKRDICAPPPAIAEKHATSPSFDDVVGASQMAAAPSIY